MAKNKIVRHPAAEQIADLLLNNYDMNSMQDVQFAIKDAFGSLFEKMLNAELDAHLGYDRSSQAIKETDNRRNGYSAKTVRSSLGEITIKTPRDREGTFDPIIGTKKKKRCN
jgi:transposase-like protein